jgi:hypothetical protein
MTRIGAMLSVMAIVLMAGGWLMGDDAKKDQPPPRVRGSLPPNFSKLGLTDAQKQEVYALQGEYGAKIAALQKEISDLRKKERAAIEKVLTDAQKARLREIVAEKAPKDDKKPDNKPAPKDDKKPDNKPASDKKPKCFRL